MIGISVYIDVLFAVNLLINYVLLCITAYITRINQRKYGVLFASALGAFYACLMFFPEIKPLYSAMCKFAVSLILIVVSFKTEKIAMYIKAVFVFYLSSFILGGVTFSLFYFTDSGLTMGTMVSNGIFYFNIPLRVLILSTALSYLLIRLVFKFYNAGKNRSYKSIRVCLDKKCVTLKALSDTGNFLADPITKEPVIIAELSAVKKILPKCVCAVFEKNEPDFEKAAFIAENTYLKLRIIPFSSLGKTNGILIGFKPDYTVINGKTSENVIIGIYNKSLSESDDYNALAGPGIEV